MVDGKSGVLLRLLVGVNEWIVELVSEQVAWVGGKMAIQF